MYDLRFKGTSFVEHRQYGFENAGAHSLTLRVLSEFGLVGFIIYIGFLVRTYIKRSKGLFYHAVSLGCISHFLCKTFKMASFEDYGTLFFLFILFFNYDSYKRDKKHQSKKLELNLS